MAEILNLTGNTALVKIFKKAHVVFIINYWDFLIFSFSWYTFWLEAGGSTVNRQHFPYKGNMNHHHMTAWTNKTSQTKKNPTQNIILKKQTPNRIMKSFSLKSLGLRQRNSLPKYHIKTPVEDKQL